MVVYWYFRNKVIFNEEAFSHLQATSIINNKFFSRWIKADSETQDSSLNGIGHSSKFSKMPRSGQNVIWSPPPLNLCKLNFDGSKIRNSSSSFDLSFEMNMAQ